MAKKKVNVRKDYSYAVKKGPPRYKRASIPRKPYFLILRGPGIDPRQIIEENTELRAFGDKNKFKFKFLATASVDETVRILKESNSWATAVVLNLGTLVDETGKIERALDKILYPSKVIEDGDSYEEAVLKVKADQDKAREKEQD